MTFILALCGVLACFSLAAGAGAIIGTRAA
jgi:hypothetical protein